MYIPIKVNKDFERVLDGVYDAYFHDGYMYLEHTKQDATIQVPLTKRQAAWIEAEYEDGFPALVYRRR